MTPLIFKRAPIGWNHDDYDVVDDGVIVGRIFKVPIAPREQTWMWASGHNGHMRRAAHGYEPTREAAMAHASVKSTSVRLEASGCRRRREEAASRTVGTLAAPEFSVGRWLGFAERNGLVELRTDAGEWTMNDDVALSGNHDPFLRDDETVTLAAAPLAGGVAVAATRNPAVVGQSIRNDDDEGRKGECEPGKGSEHGFHSLSLSPAQRTIRSTHSLCEVPHTLGGFVGGQPRALEAYVWACVTQLI